MPDDYAPPQPVSDSAFIYSYSGQKIGPSDPIPPITDIAISLGRLCRFTGQCLRFYPVLLHSFVVADLVQSLDRRAALLHDACETILNDTPTPFKTPQTKLIERRLQAQLFAEHLTVDESVSWWCHGGRDRVKLADEIAFLAEVQVLGNSGLRAHYKDAERNRYAEGCVGLYVNRYLTDDLVRPDGKAVLEFIRRATEVDT